MNPSLKNSPMIFFVLVFILSIPFWGVGALSARQLLPALPVSALAFLAPLGAAAILTGRKAGWPGVVTLLKRSFDWQRIGPKAWLILALLLAPAIMVLSFWIQRGLGVPVPDPQVNLLTAIALFVMFFIGGLGEELGWMGYAADPLQERFGALRASLLMGLVWAVWHFIGLAQASRSIQFIAWWSLGTVAYRVIIFWLYNNSGRSVFAAALFHAMINLSWQLFPVDGSYYDPQITGLITAVVAVVVVMVWKPGTIARRRVEPATR